MTLQPATRASLFVVLVVAAARPAFAATSGPDWRARYETVLTEQLPISMAPTNGQAVRVERRIGGELSGILASITSSAITMRVDASSIVIQKAELTPQSMRAMFVEEGAKATAVEIVRREKADYDRRTAHALQELKQQAEAERKEQVRAERDVQAAERLRQQQERQEDEHALARAEQQRAHVAWWRDTTMLVLGISLGVLLYFLPTIVARHRAHQNTAAIVVLNILLGWTFLGWVIALVWSCTQVRRGRAAPH